MKSLNDRILETAETISKSGRKGSGNFVIVSPEYGKMLDEVIEEEKQRQMLLERRMKIEKLKNGLHT